MAYAYKHHGGLYVAVRGQCRHDYWEYDNVQRLDSRAIYFHAPYAASTAIWLFTPQSGAPDRQRLARQRRLCLDWRTTPSIAPTRPTGSTNIAPRATASFTYDANGNLTRDGTNTLHLRHREPAGRPVGRRGAELRPARAASTKSPARRSRPGSSTTATRWSRNICRRRDDPPLRPQCRARTCRC